MPTDIIDFPISESDKLSIQEILRLEKEFDENEKKQRQLQTEINYKKSKLNISWQVFIQQCLETRKDFYALKTPAQISTCISINFGFAPTREMKNNIATTLSNLFYDEKIGRISINNKSYYGLSKYFNSDLTTLKPKYISFEDDRLKNP